MLRDLSPNSRCSCHMLETQMPFGVAELCFRGRHANIQATQKTRPTKCLHKPLGLVIAVLLTACAPLAAQQSQDSAEVTSQELTSPPSLPLKGGHELEAWLAEARIFSVEGSANNGRDIVDLGGRYGWVLTNVCGPRLLRGQFEYAVDIIPLFAVVQQNGTSYGFSFNAFSLKWNFQPHGHIVPYADVSGGGLITNHGVPPGSATFNFIGGVAGGVHYLRGKNAWSIELGEFHISNAGLIQPNSAFNSIQIRVGFGRFTRPR